MIHFRHEHKMFTAAALAAVLSVFPYTNHPNIKKKLNASILLTAVFYSSPIHTRLNPHAQQFVPCSDASIDHPSLHPTNRVGP